MEEEEEDYGDEDDDDYAYDFYDNDDSIYADDYTSMQDHFDNVELPTGVEATLPWLKDFETHKPKLSVASDHAESSSKGKKEDEHATIQKFEQFKQFDTVDSFQDHFFDKQGTSDKQVAYIRDLLKIHPCW